MCGAARFFCATIKLPAIIRAETDGSSADPDFEAGDRQPARDELARIGADPADRSSKLNAGKGRPGCYHKARLGLKSAGTSDAGRRLKSANELGSDVAMASDTITAAVVPPAFKDAFSRSREDGGPWRT